jgi:hypothetical protein
MMFVHDAPPAINFAQTHRQSKFEGFTFAVRIDVDAPPNCGSEGDILTASDLHIVESKRNGFFSRREERFPGSKRGLIRPVPVSQKRTRARTVK